MSGARFYYVGASGTTEFTAHVRTDEWSLTENAEEGSVGGSTLIVDDPDETLDFDGLRRVYVTDAASTPDTVVWAGYIADQTVSRGDAVLGRQWTLSLNDMNDIWSRRVMTGTDCKRPAENDTARMAWLFGTDESNSFFDDTTTYVSTASPVAMDACDYRGQMFEQVADDCAQASGKNWYASLIYGTALKATAWYGADTGTAYTGTAVITNDPALIDAAVYWPAAQDSTLLRDPSRIYSGVYLDYDGGAVYRRSSSTTATYGKRDTVAPSLNVKSSAKAIARANRYLTTFATPHLRLSTAVQVPASSLNQFRAGMRVQVSMTHMTEINGLTWCRILDRSVSGTAAGALYNVAMDLTPISSSPYAGCRSLGALAYIGGTITAFFDPGPVDHPLMHDDPAGLEDGSTNWRTVGSYVPYVGALFSYGVDIDRGASPSPASIANLMIQIGPRPCDLVAGTGFTLWASDDGAAWSEIVDWATWQTCLASLDGITYLIPLPAGSRTVRHLRIRITDQFGGDGCYPGAFFSGPGIEFIKLQECVA